LTIIVKFSRNRNVNHETNQHKNNNGRTLRHRLAQATFVQVRIFDANNISHNQNDRHPQMFLFHVAPFPLLNLPQNRGPQKRENQNNHQSRAPINNRPLRILRVSNPV
jgi:hypothetical protein